MVFITEHPNRGRMVRLQDIRDGICSVNLILGLKLHIQNKEKVIKRNDERTGICDALASGKPADSDRSYDCVPYCDTRFTGKFKVSEDEYFSVLKLFPFKEIY